MNKSEIKIVLLENIDKIASEVFLENGFSNIISTKESIESVMDTDMINAHFMGLRSRSKLTADVIKKFKNLIGVGCFCIGTDQVDLQFAKKSGIPIFNAPFSNTRSVAEMVIAEMVMLSRKIIIKNKLAHDGIWDKSADGCYEIKGKTIGIIGYGNIGKQVGIIAESFGMHVIYYDIEDKLSIGSALRIQHLDALLAQSDVVTLHVPKSTTTCKMISEAQISKMKPHSMLINASRGDVVDIDDLVKFLENGHIASAAIDVFPFEPSDNTEEFISPLRKFDNVILTPHIGGSTKEAQLNIAVEASKKLVKYFEQGSTFMAVNYPNISPDNLACKTRITHTHKNTPGMLNKINHVISSYSLNVVGQILKTDDDIGYAIIDIDAKVNAEIIQKLTTIENTINVRHITL